MLAGLYNSALRALELLGALPDSITGSAIIVTPAGVPSAAFVIDTTQNTGGLHTAGVDLSVGDDHYLLPAAAAPSAAKP